MPKPILLSGVKPTGRPHLGNYFGAMRQFADLQNLGKYSCYFMLADYHGLNFIQNGPEMKKLIEDLTLDYLGIGLDPATSVIFKQSDVPAHTELAWVFETITTMPYLMRAHAFKDAEAKNKEISVGTFNYPLLMAADILLYGTEIVPVGADQKQHVEYARDTAQKFNNAFGETFTLPEPLILEEVQTVPGTDGRKMSKSYGNDIPLFGTKDQIAVAVMSIVTDSSGERPENVYAIHKLLRHDEKLEKLYEEQRGNYKALKEALIEDIEALVAPLRARREAYAADPGAVKSVLAAGAERARAVAEKKMQEVREKIGVAL
ncbi:MAG TPA: tryptophan--tRNA ligase [Candidatus Paceibacterota bacterium]|nr:tryptophan--tRNA ligase [Candidatus Paceibacterota bacterium]